MIAPDLIYINTTHGRHPEDWDFTDGKHFTKAQLRKKVEYARRDPAVLAALPEVQALVAAALERAADDMADYPRTSPDYDEWTRYDEQIEYSQAIVRALIPTDHAAALEAVKAAVWEEAAKVADDHTPEKHSGMTLQAHVTGRNIAAALRARKAKP